MDDAIRNQQKSLKDQVEITTIPSISYLGFQVYLEMCLANIFR